MVPPRAPSFRVAHAVEARLASRPAKPASGRESAAARVAVGAPGVWLQPDTCSSRSACDPPGVSSPIRYARSGEVNIAYQVTGDGPFDLVLVKGFFSHLELDWESPAYAHFLERLGSFARLICFDKRGTGLSDRGVGLPDFETRMDDVRAVMDAAGSESAALFGYSEGGPLGVLFATSYPRADTRPRALRDVRKALRSRGGLPVGADPGGAGPGRSGASSAPGARTWNLTTWRRTPTPRCDLVPAARPRGAEPGRRARPDPDELEGGRP